MFGSPMLFWSTLAMIGGTVIVSYLWVRFFRPEGFEGKLVEDYEDADMQTYGSLLEKGCNEWRRMHPHHTFIDYESPEEDKWPHA
ncbi:hypothetical protein TRSC58_03273 [Trypanosoma rangeli SC58]|uniref:Uncharacterized protein n=1 Tax=Trypanosoma rangeli SC58 TaxID=429131 RepID=A0A061J281_TRYRA|nr:hypothetical protein TRSC58_03273 [Trypanosoma rangeli SC58]